MNRHLFACGGALALLVLSAASASGQYQIFLDDFETGGTCLWSAAVPDGCTTDRVDAVPALIDGVLTNPGMGFASFHFGWWCNLPPVTYTPAECASRVLAHWPENYPDAGTAYFRWHWRDLEPVRGAIDFDLLDATIQSANELGETLSFRVMTVLEGGTGVPQWLLEAPYNAPGEWIDGTFWPDYRHPTFQDEHERLVAALAQRYDDHPAVDHVDIGSVGCWGEWNTACLSGVGGIFEVFDPQSTADYQAILTAYENLIDDYVTAFAATPTVMLGLGSGAEPDWELETMLHAIENGTGWRVDCWGDWGFWGNWNHMEDLYPQMIDAATAAYPPFADAWKHSPIQLEVCGTIPQWLGFGWSADPPDGEVYLTFQWALEQHASVLNAKFTDIPMEYVPAIDDLLEANGYRLVLESLDHEGTVSAGAMTAIVARWGNHGVAPSYRPRTVTYRLRNATHQVVLESAADITSWLPGSKREAEAFRVPPGTPPGTYQLDVALLDRPGTAPTTQPLAPLYLGIEGRGGDGWYSVSQLVVD